MARTGSLVEYEEAFSRMEYLPAWEPKANAIARRAMRSVARYRAVEAATGVPWPVVAAIHSLEAGGDWSKGLHCGQRWDQKTTLVPVGKGPFASWDAAAIDALGSHKGIAWTIGGIGKFLEMYNGGGYLKRGKHSPYLWSGSNVGLGVGKFTGDGHYDPAAVSLQVGGMLILHQLVALGAWEIGQKARQPAPEAPGLAPSDQTTKDAPPLRIGSYGGNVRVLQAALNEILKGVSAPLAVDGRLGPKTAAAARQAIEVD
jgi:lysozyme family protein